MRFLNPRAVRTLLAAGMLAAGCANTESLQLPDYEFDPVVDDPAYPEGMMLAILFRNIVSALFDHVVVQRDIRRRAEGYGRAQ